MRLIIQQSIILPAPPEELFDMYLSPRKHAAITGQPVTIAATVGAEFRAFDGMLTGQILALAAGRLIVQSWRSGLFREGDPDSTLILTFSPEGGNGDEGRIDLVHLDVPDHDYQGVTEGWPKYYWEPWRRYLETK